MNILAVPLHKILAVVFSGFCAFVFWYNWVTPGNPDHVLNLIEMGVMAAMFLATYWAPKRAA